MSQIPPDHHHNPLDFLRQTEIATWEKDEEKQKVFQVQLREFIETKPLYSPSRITLPPARIQFKLDVARLYCETPTCKKEQPFRPPEYEYWYHFNDRNLRHSDKQVLRGYDL